VIQTRLVWKEKEPVSLPEPRSKFFQRLIAPECPLLIQLLTPAFLMEFGQLEQRENATAGERLESSVVLPLADAVTSL
jgi:hypothetical protein